MQNDPDPEAMAQEPRLEEEEDPDLRQTTVVEGGASGGLFLPDESDGEAEEMLQQARQDAAAAAQSHGDTEMRDAAGLSPGIASEEEDEEEDEEEEDEEDEDGDDPIIKTFDIYSTKVLNEHLYLSQYPIRPANRPYDSLDLPIEARIKPRAGHMQVDIPIRESHYYDQQRAVQWSTDPLKMQTLGGHIAPARNYLVGVIQGDALHVSALKGVTQLRPIFKYIDEHDRDMKDSARSDAAAEKGPQAPKAVQLSAKSSDAPPELSTTALIRAAEEENWTKLQWRGGSHEESKKVSRHLVTPKTNVLCSSITSSADYLEMLSTIKSADTNAAEPSLLPKTKKESK